jgi:peptidoglycan glycosyltransferase
MALGRLEGSPSTPWETANLAVGLDWLRVTPIHLALIASIVGNDGIPMKPRLLLRKENILGDPIEETSPEALPRVLDQATAAALTDAMFEVVENEEGTGRRAAVDGLALAVKTGTGGDRKQGLDGIMIGFAPAHEPRVAFAVVLEGGGKAELAAARVTRTFLESILHKLGSQGESP